MTNPSAAAAEAPPPPSPSSPSTTPTIINWKVLRSAALVVVLGASIAGTAGSAMSSHSYAHELALLHLLSFSGWFGASIWVSFIGGLVMFNNLPRHVFGRLQAKLFPAYFVFSALAVSIAMISAHLLGWGVGSLGGILATVLLNLLYFEPETTRVMVARHAVERRLGTGHEIGQLKPSDPKKANDPELRALSKEFGKLHGMSTTLNLVALGIGCYWINFFAVEVVLKNSFD
jgi:hypothetical protein